MIYVAEPGVSDAQVAASKVTRTQYEDWRKAKNRALRSFLKDKTRDSELVTITAPGFVLGSFISWTPGFSAVMPLQKTERTTGLALRLPPSSSTGSSEPAMRRLGPSLCFRLGQGSWLSVLAVRSQSRIPKCRLVAVDALTGSNPAIQDEDLVPSERRFRGTTIGT